MISKLKSLVFLVNLSCVLTVSRCHLIDQASVGELYTYKIDPAIFNWTRQVFNEQFRYTPSLKAYPDLPSWMRYMYSQEHHAGFLYGTPPGELAAKTITLEIVALNKKNYETRRSDLLITIQPKFRAPNVIQMKIDNLNWVHLMDPGRVENLRNIFRKELWPESDGDLRLVFMESAVNMGGRLPLSPQQHEGVIVHLGSFAKFSERLKQLQEEIRPLYKLLSCTYKRTSVQKIFENVGFKLDWCAFKIMGAEIDPEIVSHHMTHDNTNSNIVNFNTANAVILRRREDRWLGLHRADIPIRNYIDEFAFAFAIPGMIFGVLCGILTAILCFNYQKLIFDHYPRATFANVIYSSFIINDTLSEYYFSNIIHICEEECVNSTHDSEKEDEKDEKKSYKENYPNTSSTVQMVQYSDINSQPVTTLRSLKDPNCLLDNISMRSQSPNSCNQSESPSNTYLRPKPPPYKSGSSSRIGVDI